MRVTKLPIVLQKASALVQVDQDTLHRWTSEGLSLEWHYHPLGPIYKAPSGHWERVADKIVGMPSYFTDGDILNLTKANLRPAV